MRAPQFKSSDAPLPDGLTHIETWMQQHGIHVETSRWVYAPDHIGSEVSRVIDWAKMMEPLAACLEANPALMRTLQWLCACWLSGCGGEFQSLAFASVRTRLRVIRQMLVKLLAPGIALEEITPVRAQRALLDGFVGGHGRRLKARTLYTRMHILRDLYRLRAYLPSGLAVDPFPDSSHQSILSQGLRSTPWAAPPEPVCLELLRGAIRLLGTPADDVIRLHDRYISACESLNPRGYDRARVRRAARRMLAGEHFAVLRGEREPWTELSAADPGAIKRLTAAIEGACAVVLLFLSGPRVSELMRAGPGCLQYLRHGNGIAYPYFCADRSKQRISRSVLHETRSGDRGWIVGPAGVRALKVLERLSRIPRRVSGIRSYWIAVKCSGLWTCTQRKTLTAMTPQVINERLNACAALMGLEARTGWRGRLHSHMGRKACARFIAKRDRTALADLALQFGHLSAYVTDVAYARPDAEYRRLIEEELATEMQEAAAELAGLDVKRTFSQMERAQLVEIRDRAAHFAGEMRTGVEIRRMLGQGVRLVPCDWGMCVYRQETSLCGGNQYGPSAERRSPVLCRNCLNFVATAKYRDYWRRRVADCQRVLAHRGLPEQTATLVQARLSEAKEVLSSLSKERSRG